MNEDSDITVDFESILKNNILRKQQMIYAEITEESSSLCKQNYTVKDVLSNISKQLNALHRADDMRNDKNRLRLKDVVKPALECVNLFSLDNNRPLQSYNKFETQGVSDTQLINIVGNADILAAPRDITQEGDISLSEHNLAVNIASNSMNTLNDEPSTSKKCNYNEKQNTHLGEEAQLENNNEELNPSNCITLSPIICRSAASQHDKIPSLIYTLDAFENFETLAFPVIEQNADVDVAKAIINSQIIDRELCITTHANTTSREISLSPILTNRIIGTTGNHTKVSDKIEKEPFKEVDGLRTEIKHKKSFEEDIFCSDEENSEEENFRELPQTCALENCLTDPRDNLNKTMYVGFQTASNKSIQIHTDSFCKAQNILEEDHCNYNPTIMDLVEMCEGKNQSNAVKDESAVEPGSHQLANEDKFGNYILNTHSNISCESKEINLSSEQVNLSNMPENDDELEDALKSINEPINTKVVALVGFQTASNKKINLSDKALARCRPVFQDINLDDVLYPKESSSTKSGPTNIAVDRNLHGPQETETQYDNVKVQDELLNDETILQEFENDLIDPPVPDLEKGHHEYDTMNSTENQKDAKDFIRNIKQEYKPNENHLGSKTNKSLIQNIIADVNKNVFVGFKTANNKNIKISEHALAKTKNIFEDFNLANELNNEIIHEEGVKGDMSTHQNMEAIKAPQVTIPQVTTLKNSVNELEINTTCGFLTASKKPIIISSEALIKSKKIFEDIDSCGIEITEKIDSSNTCVKNGEKNNSHHIINCKNLTKYSSIGNKLHNTDKVDGKSEEKSKVFKTPSNYQMKLSDDVFTRSGLSKDFVLKSCEANIDYASANNNRNNILNQSFKGFQTASNKPVEVSEKSLAASRKLFDDLQINDNENIRIDEKQAKLANKHIHESMSHQSDPDNVKEKSHFQDQKVSNIKHQICNGFRSASNKVIKISEQALARSKNLFLDLDFDNDRNEQNKSTRDTTDCNLLKDEFKDNSKTDNNLKGENLRNSKRIKLSNNLIDKISQHSDQENKQVPLSNPRLENISNKPGTNFDFLFKTANNNNIKISKEALVQSKKVLTDLNQNDQVLSEINFCQSTDRKNEGNLESLIDTQLLNNFEDTLYTEDFCKDVPKTTKRCGSPILFCPRAKKHKRFEVPYNKRGVPKTESKETDTLETNSSIFKFDVDYKKKIKLSLKTIRDMEFNKSMVEVDPYILLFNFDNILNFEFSSKRNEISTDTWSVEDLKKFFVSLVNRKIIPDGWLDNHLKLIIFKLISYEIEYKYAMRGICSVKNVLEQLKYRYDKELYNVERPAFRKVLEKDDVSTKTMVVRVIAVYVDGVIAKSMPDASNIELLLTDGWYCIKASVDQMLTRLVRDRKIRVGVKLVTNGAELLNCEQGIAPWEDTSSVRLKLFGNSTRLARWHAKLGYHSWAAILCRLSRVQLEGGKVSKLRALVTRVYPTLYVEKFDDGSTVTRSERLEHLYQMKFESDRQALLEKIYEEVGKEFNDDESQDSECDVGLETGSQIHRLMKRSRDSGDFIANLTSSQCTTLRKYTERRKELVLQKLQTKVYDRMKEQGLQAARNVVPVMKIRVADVGDDGQVSKAMMSIWRPNEAVMDIIKEGMWIDAFNIVPTARRYSEVQLSAGRQTVFSRSNYKVKDKVRQIVASLKRNCYRIESLVKTPTAVTDYNEVDVVGLVFLIEPSIVHFQSTNGQHFQNVYLTDTDKNIICINFWGGLKKFGYEHILDTGLVVACMNLQKRTGNSRKGIPQYRATEFSYFTKTSKHASVRIVVDDFNKRLMSMNIKQLCEGCIALKNNSSINKNVENISPYRINYSDYNLSKHRAFIDSPLARKPDHVDDILNLSGLDFESTFKQIDTQDMSADVLLRRKKVDEKIAKLKMYGEPPPLRTIHIINKSKNATKEFKSPIPAKDDSSYSVASEKLHKKSYGAINCTESTPEISNKQMKRFNTNPVKLNFSGNPPENDGGEKVDPFAEEFDVSPPLSLD